MSGSVLSLSRSAFPAVAAHVSRSLDSSLNTAASTSMSQTAQYSASQYRQAPAKATNLARLTSSHERTCASYTYHFSCQPQSANSPAASLSPCRIRSSFLLASEIIPDRDRFRSAEALARSCHYQNTLVVALSSSRPRSLSVLCRTKYFMSCTAFGLRSPTAHPHTLGDLATTAYSFARSRRNYLKFG